MIYFGVHFFLQMLDALLVYPNLGELPDFNRLIFGARDKLLGVFVEPHLRDCSGMRFQNIQRSSFFCEPESDQAIFVPWDYFTTVISPQHNSLLWLSNRIAYPLCQLFFSWFTYVENCYVAVYIWSKEKVLSHATFKSWSSACQPETTTVDWSTESSYAHVLVCLNFDNQLWLGRNRVEDEDFSSPWCNEKHIPLHIVYHRLQALLLIQALGSQEFSAWYRCIIEIGHN